MTRRTKGTPAFRLVGAVVAGMLALAACEVSAQPRPLEAGVSAQAQIEAAYPNMPSFGAEAVPDVDGLVAYIKGDLQR